MISVLILLSVAVAAPPGGIPPGLAERFQMTNDDGSIDWGTVATSTLAAVLVLAGGYLLNRRFHPSSPAVMVQSDEEAVLAILDEHGGQLKQPQIRDALDWSDAKTSRVTSRLGDDGTITKLQLGRENVVKRVENG